MSCCNVNDFGSTFIKQLKTENNSFFLKEINVINCGVILISLKNRDMEIVTLGAGCFWCVEAVFADLKGVLEVKSGYMGGFINNPTYEQVCTGKTGHAEVAQITYDSSQLNFESLLEVFFKTHDPTTLNQQGDDTGDQYRSVIFYHSETQREIAARIIEQLNAEKVYPNPIVTELTAASSYFPAEEYHQNFLANNPENAYCQMVIQPKVDKFKNVFKYYLK